MAAGIAPHLGLKRTGLNRSRRRAQLELWIAYALILFVIWTPRPWQETIYFVAAVFVIATTALSFPGWKSMGLRLRNMLRSSWIVAVAGIIAAASVVAARHIHTLHAPGAPGMFLNRFAGYIIFAFVQQALLQDYFLMRFLGTIRRPQSAALAAAAIFSAAHLPNPILFVLTFIWGAVACLHFLRYNNLCTLAAAHAILGITLAITVPGPVIRNMRVGLGYLTYNSHHPYQHQRSH